MLWAGRQARKKGPGFARFRVACFSLRCVALRCVALRYISSAMDGLDDLTLRVVGMRG